VPELTEPLVVIVGALCARCGNELEYRPLLWDGKSTPVTASAVRNADAVHGRGYEELRDAPACGGRVLFATEPYEPERVTS